MLARVPSVGNWWDQTERERLACGNKEILNRKSCRNPPKRLPDAAQNGEILDTYPVLEKSTHE